MFNYTFDLKMFTVPNALNPYMTKFPEQYLQEPAENSIDLLIGYTSGVSFQ